MKNIESTACVILNYNDADTTISLVKKIEDYKNIEHIVVVDNCSADHSLEKLEKISNEKVVVCQSPRNGGYGFGNNIGVQYAKEHYGAKYVLIANPDVEFEESLVSVLQNKMQQDRSIAVVSANQRGVDGQLKKSGWFLPGKAETILHGEVLCAILLDKIGGRKLGATPQSGWKFVDCVAGSLLMVDADVFLSVGGYDPEMFLYCEESTLGRKMMTLEKKTALYVSESYLHNHSVTISKSYNVKGQREQLLKSTLTYLKKYCDASKFEIHMASVLYKFGTLELTVIKEIKRLFGR